MSVIRADRNIIFRKALKLIRQNAGLTQVELSKKLDRPQSYVSKCESGDRRLDMIETYDICVACGVSLSLFSSMLEEMLLLE